MPPLRGSFSCWLRDPTLTRLGYVDVAAPRLVFVLARGPNADAVGLCRCRRSAAQVTGAPARNLRRTNGDQRTEISEPRTANRDQRAAINEKPTRENET